MILKPEDLEAIIGNFQGSIFKRAIEGFQGWVVNNICPELKKLGLPEFFYREGFYFPHYPGDDSCIAELTPELCNTFDEKYDEIRQMQDIEGNYYDALLRDAISLSAHMEDIHKLLGEECLKYMWAISSTLTNPSNVNEQVLVEFNQRNQIALSYLKKRLTFYAMGINVVLIK